MCMRVFQTAALYYEQSHAVVGSGLQLIMQGVPLLKVVRGVGGMRARVRAARARLSCRPCSDTRLRRSEWLYWGM